MDYYYGQLRFAIGGRPTFLVLGPTSDTCHVSNQTIDGSPNGKPFVFGVGKITSKGSSLQFYVVERATPRSESSLAR